MAKKSHKQELLDLASDFEYATDVTVAKFHDDRAPVNRAMLPVKYVKWVVDALRCKAETL